MNEDRFDCTIYFCQCNIDDVTDMVSARMEESLEKVARNEKKVHALLEAYTKEISSAMNKAERIAKNKN
jgi:hypothetical protein